MSIDVSELDFLYAQYGFTKQPASKSNIHVYSYSMGYYDNADLVPVGDVPEKNIERALEEFQQSGFACKIRNYSSIAQAQETLFKGFFEVQSAISRGRKEYQSFIHRLSQGIGQNYEYISGEYMSSEEGAAGQNVVEYAISKIRRNSSPVLFLIEAAAGYGKTCTAFEIFSALLHGQGGRIPVLTELSRNRQAKIFRYVLLDEIDRQFPRLSYDLVSSEISSGRLTLIVDGFDELLHQSKEDYEDYEEAEPMLETIGELLKGKAFVVLTTRRTSLFSGDAFDQWVYENESNFQVIRIRLNRPSAIDWIGAERVALLEESGLPVKPLSNPVLLSFIRGLDDEAFAQISSNSNSLVEQYFQAMLDREKERQHLFMEASEQLQVFRGLASDMVEQNFTSDSSEYIQLRIADSNLELLSKVRERYSIAERPSTEDVAKKLVAHALMDRKKDDVSVGFVNDFVLGTLVGDNLLGSDESEATLPSMFVDFAATAFAARGEEFRNRLWHKIAFALECDGLDLKIRSDVALVGGINRELKDETVSRFHFDGVFLSNVGTVTNSVFVDCMFSHCVFPLDRIRNSTFISCAFFDCQIIEASDPSLSRNTFVACTDDSDIAAAMTSDTSSAVDQRSGGLPEKEVLEQFWPVGRNNFVVKRTVRTLYRGFHGSRFNDVSSAIESLRRKGLISINGDTATLETTHLADIKEILGR